MKKIFCLTILAVLCTFGVASAQQFPSVQIETQDGKTIDTKTLIDGKTKVEAKVRGDDKVVPAMVELCKQRSEGVENFDYMIGHTNIPQTADLEKAKQHLHLVAAVDDLKYLRKGGRLSAAAAVAGGMLGIKPILAVIEGKVALAGKARGLPGVYVALFKKIDEMGGIHPGYTPLLGYTVNHRELQPLLTYLQDNLHLDAPLVRQIGCVIGTHTGPGAFGIAFFDKELTLE